MNKSKHVQPQRSGTFKPQEKNVRGNGHAFTSEGSVRPSAGDLPSRYPKNKEVALQSNLDHPDSSGPR